MTINEVKKILKIKNNTQKLKDIVDYINQKGIKLDPDRFNQIDDISGKNIAIFIEKMYSTKNIVELLVYGNDSVITAISSNPYTAAKFFNVYDPHKSFYPEAILISDDYLKLATIEWTEKHIFFNNTYYLKKCSNGYTVKKYEKAFFESEDEDINVYEENLMALESANDSKELSAMIEKLSDAIK